VCIYVFMLLLVFVSLNIVVQLVSCSSTGPVFLCRCVKFELNDMFMTRQIITASPFASVLVLFLYVRIFCGHAYVYMHPCKYVSMYVCNYICMYKCMSGLFSFDLFCLPCCSVYFEIFKIVCLLFHKYVILTLPMHKVYVVCV
jgi:hypothetical protein